MLLSQALEAHTCNSSYSGGKDQEDCGSKSAPGKYTRDPISKNPFTERTGGTGPEFKPQYHKKRKQKKKKKKERK
jgi:hypothetical protein